MLPPLAQSYTPRTEAWPYRHAKPLATPSGPPIRQKCTGQQEHHLRLFLPLRYLPSDRTLLSFGRSSLGDCIRQFLYCQPLWISIFSMEVVEILVSVLPSQVRLTSTFLAPDQNRLRPSA